MNIDIFLAPYDSAQRGTRMGAGPERLIAAGLPAHLERQGHRIGCTVLDPPTGSWRAEIRTAFELATALAAHVRASRERGHFPLVLAGNCFAALGVVAGLGAGTGVLWCDAHGDFNTPETTTGGFLDGMALAALTGRCWTAMAGQVPGFAPVPEAHVWLLGSRDLDPLEAEALQHSRVRRVPAAAIDAGLGDSVRHELVGPERLYLHLDLDVLDPSEGQANEYAVAGGVSAAALQAAFRTLGERARPAALTISAYDPAYDVDGRVCRAAFEAVGA
ncbi:MAG: arginase family protein, partial [Gemmatimonadota bacterium]|nr:arginase family protein [Gemmatimonadota bacterium]